MKATCPKDTTHNRFYTTVHVAQTVEVDGEGNFIDTTEDNGEVTHGPQRENTWTCAVCGTEAQVH